MAYRLRFNVAPGDFEQVVARYPYEKTTNAKGFDLDADWSATDAGVCGPLPKELLVVRYEYTRNFPSGHGWSIGVYAKERRDLVFVIGDGW